MSNVEQIRNEEQKSGKLYNFPTNKDIKLKQDGTPKQTPNNSKKGDPHEVYPIKDKKDIRKIQQYFIDKKNTNGVRVEEKQIAARNLMMWTMGINVGLRASDLRELTWDNIFNPDGSFQDGIRMAEKKTGKFKTFYFNKYATDAITEYIEEFKPNTDKGIHVFRSREGGAIEVRTICKIIKDATLSCGINLNTGSHTMRKTFGYHFYTLHRDDINALIHLQRLFNHSSPQVTLAYIGIEDEESKEYYNGLSW